MPFTSARRRDAVLVVGARAASFLGDELAAIALVLRLQTHGAGLVAALLMANLAPMVVLAGPVGRLVDSVDNRRLLVSASAGQVVVCTVLALVSAPAAVLLLLAGLGAEQAVTGACWQALLPTLVPPDRLPRLLGRAQAALSAAGIVAPALGGVLTGAFGARVPIVVDAVTFAVVLACAVLLGTTRSPAPRSAQRQPGGLALVRRDPLLRAVISGLALLILLGSMVNVAEVFLVRVTLHASATWYGLSAAAYTSGVLVGAVLAGRVTARRAQARGFVAMSAALGVGLVAMGLAPTVAALVAVGALTGVTNGVLSVCTSALVLSSAAPTQRGRVAAVLGGVVSAMQLAAYAAGGVLAGWCGPRQVFVIGGALAVLAPVLLGRAVVQAVQHEHPVPVPAAS